MSLTNRQNLFLGLLGLGLCLTFLSGCDMSFMDEEAQVPPPPQYPQEFLHEDWPAENFEGMVKIERKYRLRPADKIEIIYNVRTLKKPRDYRLKIRDVLNVTFPFHKDLNQQDLEVQSDGTIQLNLLGSVEVFDKTIQEVQKELTTRYSALIKQPNVTLTFKESKRDIRDLREAITTSPRGQSRLVPVTPDGTVALPLVGTVMVGGKTVDEVHEEINILYHEKGLTDLEVTVNLHTIAPLRVYVLGEVRKPGLVLSQTGTDSDINHLSLVQALAEAGSYSPARAEMSKVLLVRNQGVPRPQVAVVNLYQLFENQAMAAGKPFLPDSTAFRRDVWLRDGDVIYVPTKEIAKRADYIEYVWTRSIYAVLPFSATANYTVGDSVDWLGPN